GRWYAVSDTPMKSSSAPKRLRASLLALACLSLAACGPATINIQGSYPSPLVGKLPLTVGVFYDDGFRDFSYTEINDATGKDELIINSGGSQMALFDT